jgi:hypothetical protein
MKKTILISMLAAVLLTACGPQGTPTMSPADVQGTAVAAAWTMVAQTEAAIPTATPVPPTNTPSPTPIPSNTPPPPPTSSLPTAAPTQNTTGTDNCVHPLNVAEAGPTHPTLIRNQSGGSINLSLNLYSPNAFGQCGAISLSLGKNNTATVQLPAGDWYAYAWVTLSGGKSSTSSGSFFVQPAQFDKLELCVREEIVVYKPQC